MLWPNRTGLVVRHSPAGRRIDPMRWGLPPPQNDFLRRAERPRHSFFFREIWAKEQALFEPAQRCLIILDSFALPDGPAGARTRTWFGYEDRPIFAWGGVWREGKAGPGFAGVVVQTDPDLKVQRTMPAIVAADEYDVWLEGDVGPASRIAARFFLDPDLYREPTEQPWNDHPAP